MTIDLTDPRLWAQSPTGLQAWQVAHRLGISPERAEWALQQACIDGRLRFGRRELPGVGHVMVYWPVDGAV